MTRPERTTIKYNYPIPYTPSDDFEDMRQRDQAAEAARQWARREGRWMIGVESVTRGRRNLVVRLSVEGSAK